MKKLPRDVKPSKVIKMLEKAGFAVDHITGGHYILKKGKLRTSVPFHKVVKTGTLRAILSQIEMSVEEFIDLL